MASCKVISFYKYVFGCAKSNLYVGLQKSNKNFKYYGRDKFPEKVAKARQRSRVGARNQEAVGATKVKICTSY